MEQEDTIDNLIKELTLYNMKLLANTRKKICDEKPTHICVVHPNTYENWISYLNSNRNVLFEKGINRLNTWKSLLNERPFIYFIDNPSYKNDVPNPYNILEELQKLKDTETDNYYFILAGLMIIFQVFGDGNHRTANHFYKIHTGQNISPKQFKAIDELREQNYDYSNLQYNPEIIKNKLIKELYKISNLTGGSKKTKRRKYRKKSRKNSKKNKNVKSR